MIITIDGPVATGKSTIAKRVAELLGYIYLDTGAMYRCLTYGISTKNISPEDPEALKAFLDSFQFEFRMIKGERHYFVDGKDVTLEIRSPEITSAVSKISAIKEVRQKLVAIQRSLADTVNAVCEGRDLGTVVFPHAELKIFLTGKDEVRAQRRLAEFKEKFPDATESLTLEQALSEIIARDHYDSTRENSPLTKAGNAIEIDTTELTIPQVVAKILDLVEKRTR
jgi:cytidylate kinase